MPRQPLFWPGVWASDEWSIDLPEEFARPAERDPDAELEELLYEAPGRAVWGGLWGEGADAPEKELADHIEHFAPEHVQFAAATQYELDRPDSGLAGRGFLAPEPSDVLPPDWYLYTWTAGAGGIAEISFLLLGRDDVEWAVGAWRSVQFRPGPLRRLCAESRAPLRELRQALAGRGAVQPAVTALRRGGHGGEALQMLGLALEAPEAPTRIQACLGLLHLGSRKATPDLRRALADPDPMVRMRAADALHTLREPAGLLVPVLMDTLRQPDPPDLPSGRDRVSGPCMFLAMAEARYHAARILGDLGRAAAPARQALREALWSASGQVRAQAARALARLREPRETYLFPLRQALHDAAVQSSRERASVAEALIELREPTTTVVPVLAELVEDEDWTAAYWAIEALGRIGRAALPAVPALRRALHSQASGVPERARALLARLGEKE